MASAAIQGEIMAIYAEMRIFPQADQIFPDFRNSALVVEPGGIGLGRDRDGNRRRRFRRNSGQHLRIGYRVSSKQTTIQPSAVSSSTLTAAARFRPIRMLPVDDFSAPSITGSLTIGGTEQVGQTLTASNARVSGNPTPTRTW